MPTPNTPRRSPLCGLLAALGVALAAAVVTSKLYWGYFLTRPGLNARITSAREYTSLTSFRSVPDFARHPTGLVVADESPPDELLSRLEDDPYYFYYLGILAHLERRELLRSLRPMDAGRLSALLPLLTGPGVLERPDPGYEDRQYLNGVALEAEEEDGTRLLYVAAHGAEVSNDHHPNYQILYEATPGSSWQLAESTRYFTDVAGIEGLEWPVLFIMYTIPGLALWGVVELVLLWLRRKDASNAFLPPEAG